MLNCTQNRQSPRRAPRAIALGLVMAMLGTACGQTPYVISPSRLRASAPGAFSIPARVDFLLGMDDSGSILGINDQIQKQLPGFLGHPQVGARSHPQQQTVPSFA